MASKADFRASGGKVRLRSRPAGQGKGVKKQPKKRKQKRKFCKDGKR